MSIHVPFHHNTMSTTVILILEKYLFSECVFIMLATFFCFAAPLLTVFQPRGLLVAYIFIIILENVTLYVFDIPGIEVTEKNIACVF